VSAAAGAPACDWIDSNGVCLRYSVSGTGARTLVLLHEMGGSLESWNGVLPLLRSGCRILRYDARGAGLSEKIRHSVSIDDFVMDLAGLLASLDLTAPIALAGCGIGAAIALAFAGRFADLVAGVVAMAPATGIEADGQVRASAYADRLAARDLRALVDEGIDRTFPAEFRDDPQRFRATRGRLLANDPFSYAATYRMLASLDISAELTLITCPVLLLAGSRDRTRAPERVHALAEHLARARVAVLETGHGMPNLTPGLVASSIDRFLTELGDG
jgi:3-oxoadipate enol-lactonase